MINVYLELYNIVDCTGKMQVAINNYGWATDWQLPISVSTRSSADADNGLDAFSGQWRSTNMVPFWVHCDFSLSM